MRSACLMTLWITACVRLDPDHCANQRADETPDQYCDRLFGGVCSACEASFNGCVDPTATIDPQCRPGGGTGGSESGGTSGSTTPVSSSSVGASTTDDADSSTADASGGSSSTGAPPEPVCGNGIREGGEVCDGIDVGEQNCESFSLGPGELTCNPNCTPNFGACMNDAVCGNRIIEGAEDCEAGDLGGATCETVPGFIGGDLGCADCTFNTTACDPCLGANARCEDDGQCCSGQCGVLPFGSLLGCVGN